MNSLTEFLLARIEVGGHGIPWDLALPQTNGVLTPSETARWVDVLVNVVKKVPRVTEVRASDVAIQNCRFNVDRRRGGAENQGVEVRYPYSRVSAPGTRSSTPELTNVGPRHQPKPFAGSN